MYVLAIACHLVFKQNTNLHVDCLSIPSALMINTFASEQGCLRDAKLLPHRMMKFQIRPFNSNFVSFNQRYSFQSMHLQKSYAKWWPFCLVLNVLNQQMLYNIRRTLVGSWSLRCHIACRCRSNYIFIMDLTPDFSGLGKENFITIWCALYQSFNCSSFAALEVKNSSHACLVNVQAKIYLTRAEWIIASTTWCSENRFC